MKPEFKNFAVVFGFFFLTLPAAFADTVSLEEQLRGLSIPENVVPSSIAKEKLYSVQARHLKMKGLNEISLGGANNFTSESFIVSRQANLTYRYHLSDRLSLGFAGSMVFNSRSSAGERLLELNGLLPDAAYVKYRGDLTLGMNTFYGKFRITMDRMFYFDQFVAIGPGLVNMDTGTSPAGVVSAGFVFWWDKSASIRLSVKDYLYKAKRQTSTAMANDILGSIDIGILLGGDRS